MLTLAMPQKLLLEFWLSRQNRRAEPFADQRARDKLRAWTRLNSVQSDTVAVNEIAAPLSYKISRFDRLLRRHSYDVVQYIPPRLYVKNMLLCRTIY